ncbi:TlpA family protein disulfide reductase [Micromonospora olivasterospora]|uniref:Thiol-disulfide isomerase/thioredoxin n=1 Tax=Micromonospora olivasterospora TaxID=1880 RepID=A0A562I7M3_MICOL|nr:TlpA disulfide reductase family protein [Micromonospora olivasterospora]TWH67011.1 thiol-disulfide isomerase/thioredoxin [Micromonospora olivasterospora]
MKRRLAALLLPVALLAAACTATAEEPSPSAARKNTRPSPFGPCADLTAPPASAAPAGSASAAPAGSASAAPAGSASAAPAGSASAAPAGSDAPGPAGTASGAAPAGAMLPELALPCFTGGEPVALRDIRGPAVINLWASWCPPCRKELPAFQRLSERAAGRLQVIGVNTRDTRDAAQSIGEDFGIRFPVLFDQGESLRRGLERNAVPLTVLVDGDGRIRHVDTSGALDDARLAALVREHLGVAVGS